MFSGTMAMACLLLAVNADAPEVCYMNTDKFAIPISIQPAKRAEIKELRLFVSKDEGKSWEMLYNGPPDKEGFPYFAPKDGSYWFTVQVVNQMNKTEPADIYSVPPGQRIIVDKTKPDIKLTADRRGEEIAVHWEIQEQNPNPVTFRVDYQTADMAPDQWTPVPVTTPRPSGDTSFRPLTSAAIKVRLQLKDLADNFGQGEAVVPSSAPAPTPPPTPSPIVRPTENWNQAQPLPPPVPPVSQPPFDSHPTPPPPPAPYSATTLVSAQQQSARPSFADTVGASGSLPQVLIVNRPQVKMEFEVTHIGPSGIGGVDVYLTSDDGQHWERTQGELKMNPSAGVDPQGGGGPQSGSVMVSLPRPEVVYGLYLVIKNGALLGKPAPRLGEPPQMRVEVDTKSPDAELLVPQPDPTREGFLIMSWRANDRNLDNNPITLEWAAVKQGPWKCIGSPTLPNTGRYIWQVPYDIPGKVYLRLTVRDLAGNIAVAEAPDPVVVDVVTPSLSNLKLSKGQ